MQIWPAIDLRGGKCVRLVQGDYDQETVFGEDPSAMARHWVDQGAQQLHLVDLDAARNGRPANWESVEAILSEVDVPCQLGGGIRSEGIINELLSLGLTRLVVGTSALKKSGWFRTMCRKFPEKLILGIDARNGRVATDGWTRTSTRPATELAREFSQEPLAAMVYTDIATDGMLSGPNVEALSEMVSVVGARLPVIASGGVTTADDVRRLTAVGATGCIIGLAMYQGKITLQAAVAAAAHADKNRRSSND